MFGVRSEATSFAFNSKLQAVLVCNEGCPPTLRGSNLVTGLSCCVGNALYKSKDFQQAIEHYNRALELYDEDISFLTNR